MSKKQASKLLETMVAAGLTAEQAELAIAKAVADGTVEDDRQVTVSKAIDDDAFNAALEQVAKAVTKQEVDVTKSVAAEATKVAAKVDAAVAGQPAQADASVLAKLDELGVALEKSTRGAATMEQSIPALRDMFVVIAKGLDTMMSTISQRLGALEVSLQKSAPAAAKQPVGPRSQQPAGRPAPAPGDDKGGDNPLVIRKSIFDKIRGETNKGTQTPAERHLQLARASAAIQGVTDIDVLKSVAVDLGYTDISG